MSNFQWQSEGMREIAEAVARSLGVPIEHLESYVAARRAEAQRRLERHKARWFGAVASMTDVQSVLVDKADREGHVLVKFLIDRHSGNVAALMQKTKVWNGAKGRMGTKLLVIYPDGTQTTTMERSISIKRSF